MWRLDTDLRLDQAAEGTDAALHRDGYIVVVPMVADEHDDELLKRLREHPLLLPSFPVAHDE